ncbi:MAG: tetratricopeptide repeat protein, partial [Bacteroidetes bacterium]|nr:tetratricopeptide repeat protein [Bacteroidota bacterium]
MIRKAEVATDRMEYTKALAYYDQALEKDNNNYHANTGKGIILSEFMERYDMALPYLEKALSLSPKKDTLVKINYNLGKGYHYLENYNKALYYYSRVSPHNEVDNSDYDPYLNKRISDCNYAMAHSTVAPKGEQNIINVGNSINSELPEYAAVPAGDNLYFTSKKKDDEKENINAWDGKYFESMYVSKVNNDIFTTP